MNPNCIMTPLSCEDKESDIDDVHYCHYAQQLVQHSLALLFKYSNCTVSFFLFFSADSVSVAVCYEDKVRIMFAVSRWWLLCW